MGRDTTFAKDVQRNSQGICVVKLLSYTAWIAKEKQPRFRSGWEMEWDNAGVGWETEIDNDGLIHSLDQERKWKWIWTTAVTHCDRVEISVGLRSLQWESREIYENFGWKRTEKSLEDLYMDDLQLPAEAWRQLARRDNYTMKVKPIVKTPLKNGGLD